jgi:predicted metal-dependent HD superfamily phosphohydrolase
MKSRLSKLGVATETLRRSFDQILLTKGHQLKESSTSDDEFFLDFDLTVLGEDWLVYAEYAKQIRKEYWIFPAKTYKEGRKKALASFLNREFIYLSTAFRETKEEQARANLQREIEVLLT